MTARLQPLAPAPTTSHRARTFMKGWLVLTLLAGIATFAGIYVATGSFGDGGDSPVILTGLSSNDENNEPQQQVKATSTTVALAQAATATNAPVIGAPQSQDSQKPDDTGSVETSDGNAPVIAAPGQQAATIAPTESAPAAPTEVPTVVPTINAPLITGTLPDNFILGAHVSGQYTEQVFEKLNIAKMNFIKIQIRYTRGDDPNAYGWQVQLVNQAGFGVLFGVVGHKEDLLEPGYNEEFATFLAGLASVGANAIEVWNEPNIDSEWPTGYINPVMYAELLKVSYEAIKAVNQNIRVISAALAPTGAEGAFGRSRVWNDDNYFRGMADAGVADYADCIGVHYNEGIISPLDTSGDPRGNYPTRYLQANTERAYKPFEDKGIDVPVCYTEFGYLTREGYDPLPANFSWAANVTVAQQASWLGTAALMLAETGKVRMMIIWNLDFTEYGEDPKGGYAIIRPDGSCPACDTLGSLR